jgi:hypothetical protein
MKKEDVKKVIEQLKKDLELAEIESRKYSDSVAMQNAYELGWLKGAIKSAIIVLEIEGGIK